MNELQLKRYNKALNEMVEKSIEQIRNFYDNQILNDFAGAITFDPKLKITGTFITMGYYRSREAKIYINLNWFKKNYDLGDFKCIMRTIVHEIAHAIHDLIYKYKSFRFPTENRTNYSKKNHKENFAEAFSDLVMEKTSTEKRNKKVLVVLEDTNLINKEGIDVAANVTIVEEKPAETKNIPAMKNKVIKIYDPQGKIAFYFDNYDEALKRLEVYSLKDLRYVCNKNYVGNYGPKSKYKKFNGYKFTFSKEYK